MTMLLRTLVIAAAVAAFVDLAMAANYVVGGPTGGWDLNTQLQAWANTKKFFVGDTLTFVYGPSHNVLQVSKPDYDSCVTNASIASYSGGNTAITLSSTGNSYYICGTSGHCDRGMKVVISVLPAPAPPKAAPSVPPPAAAPSFPPPAATPSSSTPATPPGSPTSSPTGSPAASPPKPAAPTNSPKLSPSVSPSKSPASSPSKSPAISPASSPPPTPAAESPASPPSPNASSPSGSTPPSSANKVNVVSFTMTVGFIIMMLLTF